MTGVSVVVPTLGRPCLGVLLEALGPLPGGMELIVVDDRPDRTVPLGLPPGTRVIAGRAAGPAAARNRGWQAARHEWIAFLDDDVIPEPSWAGRLLDDLRSVPARVGGVQGRVWVPLPSGRRPTDWERVTAGLADGEWITADMAYRRSVLARAGGFDERLPRAFREDAELAHRVRRTGAELRRGSRSIAHPVRPENRWVSLRTQRGNADDALLRRLYGPHWRFRLGIPPGRRHRHAAITTCLAVAVTATILHRVHRAHPAHRGPLPSRAWAPVAVLAAVGWAAGTAEFAAARIAPGPRDRHEVTTMLLTSAAIPPLAIVHWVCGWFRHRSARPLRVAPPGPSRVVAPTSGITLPGDSASFSSRGARSGAEADHVDAGGSAGDGTRAGVRR